MLILCIFNSLFANVVRRHLLLKTNADWIGLKHFESYVDFYKQNGKSWIEYSRIFWMNLTNLYYTQTIAYDSSFMFSPLYVCAWNPARNACHRIFHLLQLLQTLWISFKWDTIAGLASISPVFSYKRLQISGYFFITSQYLKFIKPVNKLGINKPIEFWWIQSKNIDSNMLIQYFSIDTTSQYLVYTQLLRILCDFQTSMFHHKQSIDCRSNILSFEGLFMPFPVRFRISFGICMSS